MFDREEDDKNPFKKTEEMPIYIKAMEILEIAETITGLVFDKNKAKNENEEIPVEREIMNEYAKHILENAHIIPAKIAGAEGGDIYDIRMTNASIIRKCAMEIKVNCTGLRMYHFNEDAYLDLLRNEIDEFRELFALWVHTFDEWNYIIDRWGLFNPPGVKYDDKDPDDDIPFDPSDFLGDFDDDDD